MASIALPPRGQLRRHHDTDERTRLGSPSGESDGGELSEASTKAHQANRLDHPRGEIGHLVGGEVDHRLVVLSARLHLPADGRPSYVPAPSGSACREALRLERGQQTMRSRRRHVQRSAHVRKPKLVRRGQHANYAAPAPPIAPTRPVRQVRWPRFGQDACQPFRAPCSSLRPGTNSNQLIPKNMNNPGSACQDA